MLTSPGRTATDGRASPAGVGSGSLHPTPSQPNGTMLTSPGRSATDGRASPGGIGSATAGSLHLPPSHPNGTKLTSPGRTIITNGHASPAGVGSLHLPAQLSQRPGESWRPSATADSEVSATESNSSSAVAPSVCCQAAGTPSDFRWHSSPRGRRHRARALSGKPWTAQPIDWKFGGISARPSVSPSAAMHEKAPKYVRLSAFLPTRPSTGLKYPKAPAQKSHRNRASECL